MVDFAAHARRAITVIGEPITVAGVACVGDFRHPQANAFGVVDSISPQIEIPDNVAVVVGDAVVRGAASYTVTGLDHSTPGVVKAYLK